MLNINYEGPICTYYRQCILAGTPAVWYHAFPSHTRYYCEECKITQLKHGGYEVIGDRNWFQPVPNDQY